MKNRQEIIEELATIIFYSTERMSGAMMLAKWIWASHEALAERVACLEKQEK